MAAFSPEEVFDYAVIGSGFGGSVSAMRLAEKGYRVLVLEKGKRYRDEDFAPTNWRVWNYLWIPRLRCFGIQQISFFRNVVVLHFSGVGGGSLGYASVLEETDERLFEAPAWRDLADWKTILRPHYATARRMLGVVRNPCLWPSDAVLAGIAAEMGSGDSFRPTEVGTYFGSPGVEVPDPYFGGEGPPRKGCIQCGACMVGCRHNAKNTLVKNYLFFAEKWGARVLSECEAREVQALAPEGPEGARYEVIYRSSRAWPFKPEWRVRARNVIFAAGVIGTLELLFRCRDITHSLPDISPRLGHLVRTNNEALLGAISRNGNTNYSEGIAITSIFHPDEVTHVEPVRYPAGSSLMRFLAGPLIASDSSGPTRLLKVLWQVVRHPLDFLRMVVLPGWARKTTILLFMQTDDTHMAVRLGRHLLTLGRRSLVSAREAGKPIPSQIKIGHQITRDFAAKTGSIPAGSISEALVNVPLTAHILGGCSFGRDIQTGVVGLDCQVFNYPGLYVVDSSIMPGNPGINPSLTMAALAEYAMSRIPAKTN